ncbi:hypothetical protein HPB49_016749 [Dermacentor silvarum]|uniref:Uncharacterized protein n=1 Tax=Dermacentor silvarum TaxID=543639 RepID=A0ACB8CAD8_DERSI|nr:hypothetical protein HPB49_016749 [Dermacentor silvarum]
MPGKAYFTEEEKDLLTELVNLHKTCLENKRSDAVSIHAKARTWDKLCTEYNSRPLVRHRDVKQLKKLWDNLKQKWKREKAKNIRDVMATGGGPPPPPMDERLAQIEAIVPHLAVRVPNPFDSDRPLRLPGTETVNDIVNGMIQASGRDDSDDDATLDLSDSDGFIMQSMGHSSPTPTRSSSSGRAQTSVDENCRVDDAAGGSSTDTQAAAPEPFVPIIRTGRLGVLQQALDTELAARVDAKTTEKKHREAEHKERMRLLKEEHDFKMQGIRELHADERCIRKMQHRMQIRVLKQNQEVQKIK